MRPSRTAFQRLALLTLVVCLVAFAGTRLLRAGRALADGASHRGGHHGEAHRPADGPPAEPARYEGDDVVLFEASFPFQAGDRLEVTLSSEDLVVETGTGGASVTVRGRGRDAEEAFPRRRFSARYEGGTLHVQTDPEHDVFQLGGDRASYTVVVRVPEEMAAELNLASGDVQVGEVRGDFVLNTASGDVQAGRISEGAFVRISTASGDVQAEALDGDEVTVETASGDVQVGHVAGSTAAVHTASGDVSVEAVRADRFEAHTASGDVSVESLDAGAIEVNTASGDVSLGVERAAPVEVSTGSGDVGLALPSGGFDVELESPSIEIDSGLGFQGQRGRRSAEGRLGGGGPRVAVTTGSGGIGLTRR